MISLYTRLGFIDIKIIEVKERNHLKRRKA